MGHNIHRWERGRGGLTERYKLHYCHAFAITPDQFGADLSDPDTPTPPAVAYRGKQGDSTVETEVLMTAHEGSDHAQEAERRDIGEATLEQLRADVARLSVESMTGEPFPLFLEMRRVRDRIYRLLEQQLWPRDQADLYFLLGCLSDLMATAACGLGYPQAAEELVRSGWAYAIVIDHRPLMAHLRLQHANILFWNDRPREARDLAEDGLRYITSGPNAAYLHVRYASVVGRLGDEDDARRAIAAGQEARGREHTDDVLEIGGEFAISRATHHYVSGAALGEIENAEAEAAGEIERAVSLYMAGPEPGEQHWFGGLALASIELAAMQLRAGALDAAAVSLEPVLSLPPTQRITAITSQLTGVRTELAAPIFRGSAQASALDEQIEEFGREAITVGLHSLPGAG
jgi:hypothetical protein